MQYLVISSVLSPWERWLWEVTASTDSNSWDAGWILLVVLSTLAAVLVVTCLACVVWWGAKRGFDHEEALEQDVSPGSSKKTSTSQRPVPEAWVDSDASNAPGAREDDCDPFEQPPQVEAELPSQRSNSRRRSNASVDSRATEDGGSSTRVRPTASSRRRNAAAAATDAFATADDREAPTPADKGRRRSHQSPGPEERRSASSDDGASASAAGAGRQRPPTRSGVGTPPRGKKPGDSEESVPASNDQQRGTRATEPNDSSSAEAANAEDASANDVQRAPQANNAAEELASIMVKLSTELDATRDNDVEWRRRHFKGLLLRWHPDKNRERPELAAEVLKHLLSLRNGYLDS